MPLSEDEKEEKKIRKINAYLAAGGLAAGIGTGALIGRQFRKTGEAHEAAGRELQEQLQKLGKNWTGDVKKITDTGDSFVKHVKKKGIVHALAGDEAARRNKRKFRERYKSLMQKTGNRKKARKLARRKARWGFNDPSGNIQLSDYSDARRVYRQTQKVIKAGRFGADVANDLDEARRGERKNKRKKRFWEKKAVQNKALAALIAGGTLIAVRKRDKIKKGAKGLWGKTKDIVETFEDGSSIMELENGYHTVEFGGDWYISRPTGKSVRVHNSEDGEPRKRRRKKSYETTKFKNRIIKVLGGAAAIGIPAAALIGSRMGKRRLYEDSQKAGYPLRPHKYYRSKKEKAQGMTKHEAAAEWGIERDDLDRIKGRNFKPRNTKIPNN